MRKPEPLKINWKAFPFIRLGLPFFVGILLAERLSIDHFSLDILLFLLLLALFIHKNRAFGPAKKWMPGVFINAFFFLFGYLLTVDYNELNDLNHYHHQLTSDKEQYLTGIISNLPKLKNDKWKIELSIEQLGQKIGKLSECRGKLLLYLRRNQRFSNLDYGDKILVKSKITALPEIKNPHAFDYKQYLHFQNIHYQSFVEKDNWTILKTKQGKSLFQAAFQWRKRFLSILKKHIPAEEENAIAAALLLGYKEDISAEIKEAYKESGAIHVLAVSGLHIGIISWILLFFLNLFKSKNPFWKWIKLGLILATMWGFALLTGAAPSVLRAASMFSLIYIGHTINRDTNTYNTLAVAAFAILLWNPYTLFHVGFQFSFLAVVGIVFFTPNIYQFWIPNSIIIDKIWKLTAVGISAQIAVFPLSLYYFHQLPIYFWLTGLIVIPFASVILYGGLAVLLFSFSPPIAQFIGCFVSFIIWFQNEFIHFIQNLPFHLLEGIWISPPEVCLLYIAIGGMVLLFLTYRLKWIQLTLVCLLFIACFRMVNAFQQTFQKKIIFYSTAKNTTIDFINGKKVYALDNGLATSTAYATQNNRWYLGAEKIVKIDSRQSRLDNFYKGKNCLQFHDKKMILINKKLPAKTPPLKRLQCDYLLIQGNPAINVSGLILFYDFKEIIFDGSNSDWKIEQWKAECRALNVKFKDVKKEGAYIIEI